MKNKRQMQKKVKENKFKKNRRKRSTSDSINAMRIIYKIIFKQTQRRIVSSRRGKRVRVTNTKKTQRTARRIFLKQ